MFLRMIWPLQSLLQDGTWTGDCAWSLRMATGLYYTQYLWMCTTSSEKSVRDKETVSWEIVI
ncbi:hypothetical protein GCM10025794_14800 [Massilia kyonggiensis]